LVYWQKISRTVLDLPTDITARRFAANVVIAFLPAVVLGLLFGKQIKMYLFTPEVVASTFILGGLIILWVERKLKADSPSEVPHGGGAGATSSQAEQSSSRIHNVDDMTPLDALKVGLV
jgi:undecaprenyl-diphosphatase